MPVAKKKTMSAHPPAKSIGKRQPTGTTHFQLRPNQFGDGMGAGGGTGSMNETEASQPYLKSDLTLRFRAALMIPSTLLCHVERIRQSGSDRDISYYSLLKIRDSSTLLGMTEKESAREDLGVTIRS